MKTYLKLIPFVVLTCLSFNTFANEADDNDNADLDDIRGWKIVRMETCLDAALDTIPGNARKLEMTMEGDDPTYEFDVQSAKDGAIYNVECDAKTGYIGETAREVEASDSLFKKLATVSESKAKEFALAVHPGKVVHTEMYINNKGIAVYEFDIQNEHGGETKVDINASTGKIKEANRELYEIGMEKE